MTLRRSERARALHINEALKEAICVLRNVGSDEGPDNTWQAEG